MIYPNNKKTGLQFDLKTCFLYQFTNTSYYALGAFLRLSNHLQSETHLRKYSLNSIK